MDASVAPLTAAETAWIESQLAAAAQFLADYGSAHHGDSLDGYDHAWASWLDRQSVDPADPDPVINAVGVLLGHHLVTDLADFGWVIATDDAGTTLAVHGLPGSADLLIYPADIVSRRYEARVAIFLRASYDEIVAAAQQMRS
jgi:hypothetical protein